MSGPLWTRPRSAGGRPNSPPSQATAGSALAGVSTKCCVLSTELAAADAGVPVTVVADAHAGVSDETHERTLAIPRLYGPLVGVATTDEVLTR
ncbi:isochorismatase family protein [Amycolatopsis sp. NPDC051372]|uniref:cysteine hydrolase family protein n=1 Tax=Amycolatopsis sp. NPDC051372 TaxID=3155669 RepID=UPI003435A912